MSRESQPIFERQAAVRAVRALIRPDYPLPQGRHRPIVVFEGGHGSGKTLLLDTLAARADQHVPYARVDFAEATYDDVAQLLPALAGQLARYRPRYRRLRFPRLLIALLVMEHDLSPVNFERARTAVTQLLRQRRSGSWPQRFLQGLAGAPPEVEIQLPFPVNLLRLPLGGLSALVGFTFPSRSQRWFGHRDRGLVGQAVDTLVDLSTAARDARDELDGPRGAAARSRVTGLLCEAFLADLRDCPRRVRRLHTPLLLLDNVDEPVGRAFLGRLLEARPPLQQGSPAEPLTIVATSRGALPEMAEGPVVRLEDLAGDAAPDAPDAHPLWARYRLPNLTRSDIQQVMGGASRDARAERRLVRLVHEFTAGHPEAVGVLASIAAHLPHPADSVGMLLAQPLPARGGPGAAAAAAAPDAPDPVAVTAERWLLARLLPADEPAVEALATCAAARDELGGLWLSHQSDLVETARGGQARRAAPWSAEGEAGAAVLRRLLLRRLAARPAGHPADWQTVHGRLRDFCAEREDRTGTLYHRLAVNDVAWVAEELARLLPGMPGGAWLALLRATARAPLGVAEPLLREPYALFHDLTNAAFGTPADGTTAHVGHLVTALRIVGDPLCGVARGFLYTQVASALSTLAPQSPDGLVVLQEAVAEYNRLAEWWS
ncbi:ATP-binding protein [Streptomyces sp. SBT349]|uniref:ATP-binding protein n=1 Tax=Streptomyces sp. SBT349 TaxID=1580539 RepID=UPI00066A8CF6|nr:ATP-binding protein [Streptomyces sp. SBT349]